MAASSKEKGLPAHVAIIMDGNGRWAKKRGLPRTAGHKRGAEVVEEILEAADDIGIGALTLYAFSTENWLRPAMEVRALMDLLQTYMVKSLEKCVRNNVRVRIIGDRTKLSDTLRASIDRMEQTTKDNTGIRFQIAINYGGRDEIVRAVRLLAEDAAAGKIDPARITEQMITDRLDTAGLPDPDLLIRTCGDQRLSNFLLWESAYTEFYYTDVAWPDFTREELQRAVDAYCGRERRYGGLKEEKQP